LRHVPEGSERRTALLFRQLAGAGAPGEPRLMVDEANRRRLCERWRLAAEGFVVLAPGAEFGPSKRWPAERFAALAGRAMDGELGGRRLAVVLVGAAGDREVCAAIRREAPGVHDLSGQTGLADAVDLLSAAALVVTNDSGLMHVAAALARPLVAIFGSTLPDHTPPLSSRAVALTRRLDCAPCFRRTCPLGHTDCLRTLAVDTVAQAAVEALGAGRPRARRDG
jgi:heptosyltransferase-2